MKNLQKTGYFNTFGGNAVSCAAAWLLWTSLNRQSPRNALSIGKYLKDEIKTLANKYDLIGDVRGKGLLLGRDDYDFDMTLTSKAASSIVQQLKESGVRRILLTTQ